MQAKLNSLKSKRQFLNVIILLTFSSSSCASSFLTPGRWVSNDGSGYYCIKNANKVPGVVALETQASALGSTGDGRWISKCTVTKYKKKKRGFYASMICSQIRERNKHKTVTNPFTISGRVLNKTTYLLVQKFEGPLNFDKIVTVYRFVSESCRSSNKFYSVTIKEPKTKTEWTYLNPLYQHLIGLPSNSSFHYSSN